MKSISVSFSRSIALNLNRTSFIISNVVNDTCAYKVTIPYNEITEYVYTSGVSAFDTVTSLYWQPFIRECDVVVNNACRNLEKYSTFISTTGDFDRSESRM